MKRFATQPFVLLFLVLLLSVIAGCNPLSPVSSNPNANANTNTNTNTNTNAGSTAGAPPASGTPSPSTAPSASDEPGKASASEPNKHVALTNLSAVRIIDPKAGWVGGDGWIARTDDAGNQWKLQYSGKNKVEQIFALNGQNVWASVDLESDGSKRELLQSSNGGTSWSQAGQLPNQAFIHFVNNQEGFAANAHTTDGGKSWSLLPVPEHTVGDTYFHDKNNGWAITAEDKKIDVKRTTDGGKTWKTVLTKDTEVFVNGTVIRSAGAEDVWVEWIGDSGMSQTSYSLLHSSDGGKSWVPVLVNSTAGAGPAPGFPASYNGTKNTGSKPGELYVVNPKVAFMGGYCPACDNPNTVGSTTDGGKTWVNGKDQIPGSIGAMLAISDPMNGWWISKDATKPSVMYTTSDGGKHWKAVHTFDPPPKS